MENGTPEETRVKRRMVQAMLFPHNAKISVVKDNNSQNGVVKRGCKEDGECEKVKKKRGRKPISDKSKVQASAEGGLDLKGDGTGPTDVAKTSLKSSKRQNPKRQCKVQVCIISDGEDDNCASPSTPAADIKASQRLKRQGNSTPRKQKSNVTPKKKSTGSVTKGACSRQTSPDLPNDETVLKSVPNLRLEAKFIAEENSRIYAGKQLHPFFSSRKVDKINQDMVDVGIEQPSSEKEGNYISIYPIHVYEKFEDNTATLDWKKWSFSDRFVTNSSCNPDIEQTPIFRGSIRPLQFNNYIGVPQSNSKFLSQNHTAQSPSINLDQEAQGTITFDCFLDSSSSMTCDGEQSISSQDSCLHHPENCLWTDKHVPEKALQVCGNGESVKRLSEWLYLWHNSCSQTSQTDNPNGNMICQSDCDSEDMDEEPSLENVLLVTGPVGSGKSTAIYACAKEQGFQVIEVNASDWRSGSLVKQKFGEAVESHWIRGSNTENSEVKCQTRSSPCATLEMPDSNFAELLSSSDGEDFKHPSERAMGPSCDEEIGTANSKKQLKTLILFEDVDATFCEDYGFISTIHLLSKTAKRPMILTSNSENPLLPSNMDRLHLRFTMPSMEELIGLASVVCAAEEANVHPCLVEHFVALCKRDIRKTIISLQFWCQGQDFRKGNKLQSVENQHLLDIDASHWLLQKLISWSFPSRLSEFVDEEITKSLIIMNEINNPQKIVNGVNQNEYQLNDIPSTDGGAEQINAKKEEMLSLHWSLEDDICGLNGFSHSPDVNTHTVGRRKFSSVIFSDSDDEDMVERKPTSSRRMLDNSDEEEFEVEGTAPLTSLLGEKCQDLSTESLNQFQGEKVEECTCRCAGLVDCSHMNGASQPVDLSYSNIEATCNYSDISYVPESLIVPETLFDIDNQTEFSSKTVNSVRNICEVPIDLQRNEIFNSLSSVEDEECFKFSPVPCENQDTCASGCHGIEIFNSLVPVEGEECFKISTLPYEYQDTCASSCHISLRSVSTDLVDDSQFDREENIPRGYQVMDECSRVDFIRRCESSQMVVSIPQTEFVQETWRKLRNSEVDVSQHVTTQERDIVHALQITCGLCNVISDSELLVKDCQPHLHDSLYSLTAPRVRLQSDNWHDNQLEMTSVFSEHGVCLFAKEAAVLGLKLGSVNVEDLAWEMLASSTDAVSLGKLVTRQSTMTNGTKIELPGSSFQSKSKTRSRLSSVLQCVVPTRSYLSLQGDANYEYLSALSQISRVETNRLLEHVNEGQQRRSRGPRHYLKAGTFTLTPDDISFLEQWNYYQQLSSQSYGASNR